jgi:hypothetical protein
MRGGSARSAAASIREIEPVYQDWYRWLPQDQGSLLFADHACLKRGLPAKPAPLPALARQHSIAMQSRIEAGALQARRDFPRDVAS